MVARTEGMGYAGYCAAIPQHRARGVPLGGAAQHRHRPQRSALQRSTAWACPRGRAAIEQSPMAPSLALLPWDMLQFDHDLLPHS